MKTKNKKFFSVAKAISKLSDFKRIHIGAILVYKNQIISTGQNEKKTHPMQKEFNKYRFKEDSVNNGMIHAEMKAMLSIPGGIDTRKIICYTYREDRFGHTQMARPCRACLAKIKELGIKKIYYTTPDGIVEEILK